MIFLPDTELRPYDRIFIRMDKTPQRDGREDRQPMAITAVCTAINADAL